MRTRSVGLIAVLSAVVWFVIATVVIPVRVTLGAGSLRCGTVLDPDTASEIGDVCPKVTHERLSDTWPATAAFTVATVLAVVGGRSLLRRRRIIPAAASSIVGVAWLSATALLLYWITRAYSVRRS
jgi:hypothetical protein